MIGPAMTTIISAPIFTVMSRTWNGDGVEKDDSWAAFWYEMAGQQGDPQAQFSTGWFYMTGTGVKQDKRKGLK